LNEEVRKLIFQMALKIYWFFQGRGVGKSLPLATISNFAYRRLNPSEIIVTSIQKHKMYVHPFYIFAFEKFETELFKSLIRKRMVVADIGAYAGYYTLVAADLVGEEGEVYAFEPNPENYALLLKNLEVNRCQNVIPVQKAIADRNGKTRLFLAQENKGDHRLFDSNDGRESITVDVTSLDAFFKERDYRVDVIKMDIQGSEMAALKGMTKILEKNDDLKILTEFWPNGIRMSGASPEEFLKKLMEFGFELYHVDEKRKLIEPIDVTRAMEMCKEGRDQINIFCKKKSFKQISTKALLRNNYELV